MFEEDVTQPLGKQSIGRAYRVVFKYPDMQALESVLGAAKQAMLYASSENMTPETVRWKMGAAYVMLANQLSTLRKEKVESKHLVGLRWQYGLGYVRVYVTLVQPHRNNIMSSVPVVILFSVSDKVYIRRLEEQAKTDEEARKKYDSI